MKGVLSSSSGGSTAKKVGFKLIPPSTSGGENAAGTKTEITTTTTTTKIINSLEEKKTEDVGLAYDVLSTEGLSVQGSTSHVSMDTCVSTPTFSSSNATAPAPCLKQTATQSTASPDSSEASGPQDHWHPLSSSSTSKDNQHKQHKKNSSTDSNSNNSSFRKKFRLPRYFRNRRRAADNKSQGDNSASDEEEMASAAEHTDDPVMAVFQSRYTNRVRWSLSEHDDENNKKKGKPSRDNKATNHHHSKVAAQRETNINTTTEGGALDTWTSPTNNTTTPKVGNNNSINIGKFVKGALFGSGGSNKDKAASDKEFQNEVAKEVEAQKDLVWESNNHSAGAEVLYTSSQRIYNQNHRKYTLSQQQNKQSQQGDGEAPLAFSFTEDPKVRYTVVTLIRKGRRAQSVYYRYDYAVKYFVRALDMLTEAKYPDQHPTVRKTLDYLNEAHHKLSSFNNSANIVKIGIKYEDSGELARALKMYSIAYRIRRDNLSRSHPSLVVLLNMLGAVQSKRGDYEEAMQIYELALRDPPKDPSALEYPDKPMNSGILPSHSNNANTATASAGNDDDHSEASALALAPQPPAEHEHLSTTGNLLAKSVTYREMGTIFEKWGRLDEALKMYHLSLDCVADWKAAEGVSTAEKGLSLLQLKDHNESIDVNTVNNTLNSSTDAEVSSTTSGGSNNKLMDKVRVKKSYASGDGQDDDDHPMEKGEMEMLVGLDILDSENSDVNVFAGSICYYDSFFPPHLEVINAQKGRSTATAAAMASGDTEGVDSRDDYADIDVALTIHQIAQLFRRQGQFSKALEAYAVALRGMKYSLGNYHPNVAAILGNYGNLQKEMGDLNAAYDTYQEVLGIESYRLGLSHPDVAVTLHNIATIDSARGNHVRALQLYVQVMKLQEKLFGPEHISIAVTAACMGDVYEALGQMKDAFESYEDSLRLKTMFQGHHSLEVARILHKLAKVALKRGDHRLASSYVSRALFVYRLNKIPDDHLWVVDAHRDSADIDASLALTKKMTFEC